MKWLCLAALVFAGCATAPAARTPDRICAYVPPKNIERTCRN
jgi:hypothetical protein